MPITMLPQPEGFELRNRRADRDSDESKWLPDDAMYDASRELSAKPPAVAMLVVWYTRAPNGKLSLHYRTWQEHDRQCLALLADAMLDMGTA